MKRTVAAFLLFLVGCGGGSTPTLPSGGDVPVAGTGQAVVTPAAPAATPTPDPLKPSDYLTIVSKAVGDSSVAVTIRNKDNGEAYDVRLCQYTPGGGDGKLLDAAGGQVAPGSSITLTVDKSACGTSWQADALIAHECPATPKFAPGVFIGYATGDVPPCPRPTPTPKPTPTPEPCPNDTLVAQHVAGITPICKGTWKFTVTHAGDFVLIAGDKVHHGAYVNVYSDVAAGYTDIFLSNEAQISVWRRESDSTAAFEFEDGSTRNASTIPCHCVGR